MAARENVALFDQTSFAKFLVQDHDAIAFFNSIVEEGGQLGLRYAGVQAIDSLRLEKGYRHWGHDVADEDIPLEARLSFTCAYDKPSSFIGRDALLRQKEAGVTRKLVQFKLTDFDPLLYKDEPILRDGKIVGRLTSGSYGHAVGEAVGMGYVSHEGGVDASFIKKGSFEIDIAGTCVPEEASLRPFYDPKSERVKK